MITLYTVCIKYTRPGYREGEYELIADSCERSERESKKYAAQIKAALVACGYKIVETTLRPKRTVSSVNYDMYNAA